MKILRNILAFVFGAIVGFLVNGGIVMAASALVPAPDGVNPMDAESLARSIHLFEPKHFIGPFLAHAVGTFVGALVAYVVAASHKALLAYLIGVLTLLGGLAAAFMIPAPWWFIALDLIAAYIPMAWLAIAVGRRMTN